MTLYGIHTKSGCDAVRPWCDEFMARHACPSCKALDRSLRRTGIDVRVLEHPDKSAVNCAGSPSVGIARLDFLGLFAQDVDRHLHLGRAFDANGRLIEGFVTFISERPLVIRGGPESTHRTCGICGRFMYCAMGPSYVMADALTGQALYEAGYGRLVVAEELRARIDRKKWKGIYIAKLPVRDEPLDGITEFPENYFYWGGT